METVEDLDRETVKSMVWLLDATRFLLLAPSDTPKSLGELLDLNRRREYINNELVTGCVRDTLLDDPGRVLKKGIFGEVRHVQGIMKAIVRKSLLELPPLEEDDYRLFASLLCQDRWNQGGNGFDFVMKKADCEKLHLSSQYRNMNIEQDGQDELGIAGRFSRALFIKQGLGYVVIGCIDTGAVFEWKDELRPNISAMLLSTERIAELLVEAESKRAGPHGPATITVKLYKDTRYPDILVDGYTESLMVSLKRYAKRLGHSVIHGAPICVYKSSVNPESMILQELLALVHPQHEEDYSENLRLEYEYARIMGFPSHSRSKIPGYWDPSHMIFPVDLREKFGRFLIGWMNTE